MTAIHIQRIGDRALPFQYEFERLGEIAPKHQEITLQLQDDDVPTLGFVRLAEQRGGFDFWSEAREGIHSPEDGEPV